MYRSGATSMSIAQKSAGEGVMLNLGKPAHCANGMCDNIFLAETKYVPLIAFCPCCRAIIVDELGFLDRVLEEAEDDGPNN